MAVVGDPFCGKTARKPGMDVLSEFLLKLKEVGDDCNDMAQAMNDKSFYSITIKESVVVQVMERVNLLSENIINVLQNDDTGRDKGERSAISELPAKES